MDHVLTERRWLEECVTLWRDLPILFVRAQCPWEVVEARVHGRSDRPGLTLPVFLSIARWQFDTAHAHDGGLYDLTVETAQASPEACAALIVRSWREGEPPVRSGDWPSTSASVRQPSDTPFHHALRCIKASRCWPSAGTTSSVATGDAGTELVFPAVSIVAVGGR